MINVSVVTLGCKVNQAESLSIISSLNNHEQYNASEGLTLADVYILNTCSVTAEADRKSRQYVGKMRKLNNDCKIIVVGCSSQNNASRFECDNVVAVGGTSNKCKFVLEAIEKISESILSRRILLSKNIKKTRVNHEFFRKNQQKTRRFIKIQDGCNRFCTYCIIPYLRGRSVSVPVDVIVEECKKSNEREIVLTGIDISDYGKDIGSSLCELVKSLSGISARKRLGSLECEAVDEQLLHAMKESNFCPHFHLSLQSGDNDVLRSMNRHYDTAYFHSKVDLIRKIFPDAGITTDVIVGFPTETEESFSSSCDFIKMCNFSDIHVFPYSSRSGTIASKKYNELNGEVVERRVRKMLELKKFLHSDFIEKNLGKVYTVYTEDSHGGLSEGYTPNYIKVYSKAPCGSMVDVRLISRFNDGVLAEVVGVRDNSCS